MGVVVCDDGVEGFFIVDIEDDFGIDGIWFYWDYGVDDLVVCWSYNVFVVSD